MKPFKPTPVTSHTCFEIFTFIPSFFKQSKVLKTSSDLKRLIAFDFPSACEARRAHLIDILLSPSIVIFLLNGLILFKII